MYTQQKQKRQQVDFVRLFLLQDDANSIMADADLLCAAQKTDAIANELALFSDNPIRYRSDRSALIHLAIGLISLDLPVMLVTLVAECLVSINEKVFGAYSEQKSWAIGALIKKKAKDVK